MITIKQLTARNFLSIGNATQSVDFDRTDLTLVLGENLDVGDNGSRNGVGKAQPLHCKIKTPTGWTTMGEIDVGDQVLCPDGSISTVLKTFPQGNIETYRVTFADGRTTECCKNHLWAVFSHRFSNIGESKSKVLTTKELIPLIDRNDPTRYVYIPLVDNQLPDIELPMDPYIMGALLGGGSFSQGTYIGFTSADDNIAANLGLSGTLSHTKFIPEIYKSGSAAQKLDLLAGLVDTCGHVGGNGVTISTSSEQMANDIQEMVWSIGGIASVTYKAGLRKYSICIRYSEPMKLSKLSRTIDKLSSDKQYKNLRLRIDKIEKIGCQESKCILIDHHDHLYITDNYIVTHNTSLINALSYALYGSAITNIKKENLINKSNGKSMLVTLDFEKDNIQYRIERGRKPNITKFFVGEDEQSFTDDAQGDSRETQAEIERLLNMSHDIFKHIVALNTYTEPFLTLRANDQRTIIEQLLGITLLSEKADILKEQTRITKDSITAEEYRIKAVNDANSRITEQIESLKRRQTMWIQQHTADINKLQLGLDALLLLDIDNELAQHKNVIGYNQKKKDLLDLNNALSREIAALAKENKIVDKIASEINVVIDQKCHSCGQEMSVDKHAALMLTKVTSLHESALIVRDHEGTIMSLQAAISDIGELGQAPDTFYEQEQDAIHHRITVDSIQQQIINKVAITDPYSEQIDDMINKAIETIEYTVMNSLSRTKEHQEFLLKLLTNKDSFIRKRIIDQNLTYLNARLEQYLGRIGLPHTVRFLNDLSVSIMEYGRDLDFFNLSRGEMQRLIISLSFAFRDVYENLYQPINLLFVDEMVDAGLDAAGIDNAISILKQLARDNHKSVWLVSHKDELISRVNSVLKVVKSNGFTEYANEVEEL